MGRLRACGCARLEMDRAFQQKEWCEDRATEAGSRVYSANREVEIGYQSVVLCGEGQMEPTRGGF